MVEMNIMEGAHMTPEKLAVNPWHQMPSMKDGDFCMAESNAICRYLDAKYGDGKYYNNFSIEVRAKADWSLDWASTNFSNNYKDIWYPVAGFGAPPADQDEANKKAAENLDIFAKKMLSDSKFICGDSLSIADYKCAVLFWYLDQPAILKKTGFAVNDRIKQYIQDFLAATKSASFLDVGKGFMASKEA